MSGIPVFYRARPFLPVPPEHCHLADEGLTIAQIVAATPNLPQRFDRVGEAYVNDELVPRESWHLVRPRRRDGHDIAVTLSPPLRGDTLKTVASIAIIGISLLVSGGALAPLVTGLTATLLGGAIAIGGALAIQALSPPPSAEAIAGQNVDAGGGIGQASLSGNILAPGAPVPRVIGTHKVYPPLACQPLVEPVGDDEVVEAVYILAGPTAIDEVRADGALLSENSLAEFEIDEGFGASTISLVTRQSKTDTLSIELSEHKVQTTNSDRIDDQRDPASCLPEWHSVRGRESPDEIWLVLQLTEGLFKTTSPDNSVVVPIRMRFREVGDVTWVNGPEIHLGSKRARPFQITFRLKWATIAAIARPLPETTNAPRFAFKSVPVQATGSATDGMGGWTADSYFSAGAGNDLLSASTNDTSNVINTHLYRDRVEFFLDPATFPKGRYEIQIMRGHVYESAAFVPATYVYDTTKTLDFFGYYLTGTVYQIDEDQHNLSGKMALTRASYIWNEPIIASQGDFAAIAIKGRNINVRQLSVLASGYVKDWDGSGWNTVTTTSNPAAHVVDILTGLMNAGALPYDLLDEDDFIDFRTHCIDNGYTCNAVMEGKMALDAAAIALSCGRARLRSAEKWGIIIDRDRSAEETVQTFSPRNMRGFRWTKSFARASSGFRMRISDAADDYEEREFIVRDPDLGEDDGRYEDIRFEGLVDEADGRDRAEFDLRQFRLRAPFYFGEINLAHLRCKRGDLVAVQHYKLSRWAGGARIKNVLMDGSSPANVIGLDLDGSVPTPLEAMWSDSADMWSSYSSQWSAPRAGIAINLRDGTLLVKEVVGAADEVSSVSFVTPFPDLGSIVLGSVSKPILDVDLHLTSGPLGEEYKRMIVFAITPKSDLTAAMTFIDEAPELFA